jgi:hypothetical protein
VLQKECAGYRNLESRKRLWFLRRSHREFRWSGRGDSNADLLNRIHFKVIQARP